MPPPLRQPSFIRADSREMPIGDCGLSIIPNAGSTGLLRGWRRYHHLSLWADPADDGFPRLVITDVELHVKGDVLAALNGLRIDQNLDDGDSGRHVLPWIRPGSMVGMAQIVFEPASREAAGKWDPDARRLLARRFSLGIDRVEPETQQNLWRVEVRANHENCPLKPAADYLHAVYVCALDIEAPD